MFRITLKNYRCFTDEKPASIEIDAGFTAFIGTNNSGKSSFLRFFHEFRNVFQNFGQPHNYQPHTLNVNLSHVEDWFEVFSNRNSRDLVIEIEDANCANGQLSKMRFTIRRDDNHQATASLWVKHSSGRILQVLAGSPSSYRLEGDVMTTVDASSFIEFFSVLSGAFYVGPFRNAISEGGGDYYDISIVGTFLDQI